MVLEGVREGVYSSDPSLAGQSSPVLDGDWDCCPPRQGRYGYGRRQAIGAARPDLRLSEESRPVTCDAFRAGRWWVVGGISGRVVGREDPRRSRGRSVPAQDPTESGAGRKPRRSCRPV